MVAIKQERETWVKHGCISRKNREAARNTIDVKRGLKWKCEPDARTVHNSQQTALANTRRVIRARLTMRGFKDVNARNLDNYAGTSQRYSKRVLVSVVVRNQWDICASDISHAFLQGAIDKELAEATGEPCARGQLCVARIRYCWYLENLPM